ncbi:MAG: YraN family protein [Ruminococcaceae bacterium]|nr:YraN family protein [Oscillospiraceae bacterium]
MNNQPDRRTVGRFAEQVAASYLAQNGYAIVCTNYTLKGGEIDIIAENDEYIVFVEVKSRDKAYVPGYGRPSLAVTEGKKRRVVQTAQLYLLKNPCEKAARIDVIEVITDREGGKPKLRHYENAFDATGRSVYDRSSYRY